METPVIRSQQKKKHICNKTTFSKACDLDTVTQLTTIDA
jgi:hypothetical protein